MKYTKNILKAKLSLWNKFDNKNNFGKQRERNNNSWF